MDIVFDPPGSGMFTEVYLYEELMEADLHAIVCARSDAYAVSCS
jgi:mitogen-activated protein kinase 7